jgi:hypothetical protein
MIISNDVEVEPKLTPAEHQATNPPTWHDFLENQIARDFEDNVGQEQNHRRNVEHSAVHFEVRSETLNLRISNIDSVEESEHVDNKQDRHEVQVNL